MSELLGSKMGSGGAFVASFVSACIRVAPGATGTYLTLTPPIGERVKLTGLASITRQTNLTTVTIGGANKVTDVTLEDSKAISDANADNEFKMGFGSPNQESFIGKPNEILELKTNVATSHITVYTFQFGA
tara:strand:+ start:55 stop:447 length:393 start_codon:yes stop_codon:yes gene_type:complete